MIDESNITETVRATDISNDKPLTARSVLASALLGMEPPEAPVARLVRLAGLFAINENRARVALSRMVAAGEASTDGTGRYRLEGDLLARKVRQSFSRSATFRRWKGQWTVVVATATAETAGERVRRRRALAAARLAELREGVWLRPDNVDVDLPGWLDGDVVRLGGKLEEDPRALAGRLWDLGAWAGGAGVLLTRLAATAPGDRALLAPGFVLSASVLRHLQADPLLPPELLPDQWPGRELRAVYDDWDRRYRRGLAAWQRSSEVG